MNNSEIKKSKPITVNDISVFTSGSVQITPVIMRPTGCVSAVSMDSDTALTGKISPFDTFIQVIAGKAEIDIDGQFTTLEAGQAIILPAHSRNIISALVMTKLLSTIIKSGYEE
jgi:quercetin dioxygenase-like cupin family protein